MPAVLRRVPQLLVLAIIVATMLYVPAILALAVGCAALGIPVASAITFGGVLGTFTGLLAWWAMGFVLVLVYAAWVFPWDYRI